MTEKVAVTLVAPHPSETLVRDLFAALLGLDLATLQLLVAPQVMCHLPGQERVQGFEQVFALWSGLAQRSANRLELTLLEVLVGSHYAAALGALALMQSEHIFKGRLVCLMRLDGGRVAEFWLYTHAQVEADETGA